MDFYIETKRKPFVGETMNMEALRELSKIIERKEMHIRYSGDEWFRACRELQESLLQDTMIYVYENVPYYRTLLDKLRISPAKIETIEDLSNFPFTKKQDLLKNWSRLISRSAKIIGLKATAATIEQAYICVSREELEALALVYGLRAKLNRNTKEEYRPIILRMFGTHRIIPPTLLVQATALTVNIGFSIFESPFRFPLSFPGSVDTIIDLLTREFSILGKKYKAAYIAIYPDRIKYLIHQLLQYGVKPKEIGLKAFYTTGGHATKALRKFVSEHLGVEIFSGYSLSEINTTAMECDAHTLHHFDVFAIPEVVDPTSGQKVPLGREGVLVLTSLYPFQQGQPLIRYWTDDLVVLTADKCKCGLKCLSIKRFVGRRRYCIDLRNIIDESFERRYFSYIDVYEVLDTMPELTGIYRPKFFIKKIIKQEHVKILVEVEPTYRIPHREKTEKIISEEIRNKYEEWGHYFSDGKIVLNVKLKNPRQLVNFFRRI